MSVASARGSQPPLPGNESESKSSTISKPASFFRDGDGTSLEFSTWSATYRNVEFSNNNGHIVNRIGQNPRFVREENDMARGYLDMGYQIFDGLTCAQVISIPGTASAQTITGTTQGEEALDRLGVL